MVIYHDTYGVFPPAYVADASGKPMHSWRVLLLPYLGHDALYNNYDFSEPWNGPNNSKLLGLMPPQEYACGRDPDHGTGNTSYLAVVGKNTALRGGRSMSLGEINQADGTTDTLLIVECTQSGIHWMEPRDLDIDQMVPTINAPLPPPTSFLSPPAPPALLGPRSTHLGGANAVTCDGRAHFFSDQTPAHVLRALLTATGGERAAP